MVRCYPLEMVIRCGKSGSGGTVREEIILICVIPIYLEEDVIGIFVVIVSLVDVCIIAVLIKFVTVLNPWPRMT